MCRGIGCSLLIIQLGHSSGTHVPVLTVEEGAEAQTAALESENRDWRLAAGERENEVGDISKGHLENGLGRHA